ncbi:hypothetical protein C8R44DRAFT_888107 [Mycena epipterygia]|nr:hypothetical protein C8R44DRAFT_888107 [Mycena epipterygia]
MPTYKITFHTDTRAPTSEEHYVASATGPQCGRADFDVDVPPDIDMGPPLPFLDATEEAPDVIPVYATTTPCDEKGDEKGAKIRQNVAHMDELKAEQAVFLDTLLSLNYSPQLHNPCACGLDGRVRTRTVFFEKHNFCRVMKNASVALGHYGERCPDADMARTFTLVDSNGIHATAIKFCRCKTVNGKRGAPEFQQLLRAGIFPGRVKEPKTGYTLGLLEYYHQERNQGKGSAYNFVLVLQRMADPFFAGADIYANFLAITRFHQNLDILMQHGHAHGMDVPVPGEVECPYPNRPMGYLGMQCAACPERGVNMPMVVDVPKHLISMQMMLDGNYKANLFYKRDDGSDTALTDGKMYFPNQKEFEGIAKAYIVQDQDKEVPCNAHIGSIRYQGQGKYGNVAVSGIIGSACDHSVVAAFIDMLVGEAFGLGTYAQREHLRRRNSPPHGPASTTPLVQSYDSYCSFKVNAVERAIRLFPEETWLHELLATIEGQIPADHINGHGPDCQCLWQAVYQACRAHFHGETAEVIWAFLNALGSSTRQMTGAARHDIINFVIDPWNTSKVLRQAQLVAAERSDVLRLLSCTWPWWRTSAGSMPPRSELAQVDKSMLASLVAEERRKSAAREAGSEATTSVAQWIHDGMDIERQQLLTIALLNSHRGHPLQETWDTITKLRDSMNLSALDVDEPELTAIQLPSYRMKHGQRTASDADATNLELREAETKLRCSEADSGILAVRAASLALSAIKKARELDYHGQAGVTRSQRNVQKAELMKFFEIGMYNKARASLIHLGYMAKDACEPYPQLTLRDTRRKETHLHRAWGDSRLFDGTAWYLQSGGMVPAVCSLLSPIKRRQDADEPPQLLAGTQTLRRAGGLLKSPRKRKRLRDLIPEGVVGDEPSSSEAEDSDQEMSPSKRAKPGPKAKEQGGKKKKGKGGEGWLWLEKVTRGQNLGDEKLAEYKTESDRVQWFRAEAEMYRWLEAYERSHAELMRVIERFRRDSVVWVGRAEREESERGDVDGGTTFARMQAAMYRRLQHNAQVIFQSPESGAHHDWVSATTFDELVTKINGWRDEVFKWMDGMGIDRAYKLF